mgnify:CR=1 FL=1
MRRLAVPPPGAIDCPARLFNAAAREFSAHGMTEQKNGRYATRSGASDRWVRGSVARVAQVGTSASTSGEPISVTCSATCSVAVVARAAKWRNSALNQAHECAAPKKPQATVADHSGDAYFDFVYWHDWPNTLNLLAKYRVR